MPYYSELGVTSTPSSSAYSSLLLSGPYSNHSSIIASNYTPFSKPTTRQIRSGFKPHLSTISEFNSPLRRISSPSYGSLPYGPIIKTINTADIDVSSNRYRKFERPKTDSIERKKEIERPTTTDKHSNITKSNSPRRSVEEREAKPNKEIKRDRTTIRFQTIHKDTLKNEISDIKSWRDNFKPEELRDGDGEAKRRKKTPGEILMEKFLIRSKSKENVTKGKSIKRKRISVKRSPSFRDICQAITSDNIDQELNPGQPENVQRKQSRHIGTETILREIRRASTDLSEEDINILDTIIANQEKMNECPEKEEQFESRGSVRKKRLSEKRSVKENGTELLKSLSKESISETESKSPLKRRSTLKKVKRTVSNTSDSSELESLIPNINESIVRDISQVDIEQTKFKPKPVITASVGDIESTKPTLKAVINDVEVEESPKKFPDKKFKFNVIVEVDENENKFNKKSAITVPKMTVSDNNKIKVLMPKSKELIITKVLKQIPLAENGFILNEKQQNITNKQIIKTNAITEIKDEISIEKQSSVFSKFNEINKKDNCSSSELSNKIQTPLSKTKSETNPFQKDPLAPVVKTKFHFTKSNSSSPKSTVKESEEGCDTSPGNKAPNDLDSNPGSPLKKITNFFQNDKTEILQNINEENLKLKTESLNDEQTTKTWFDQNFSVPSTPTYSNKNIFNKEKTKENEENSTEENNNVNGKEEITTPLYDNKHVIDTLGKINNEETRNVTLEKLTITTGENYNAADNKSKAWFEEDSSIPSTPVFKNKIVFNTSGAIGKEDKHIVEEKLNILTEENNKAVENNSKAWFEKGYSLQSTPVFSNTNIFNKTEKTDNYVEKKEREKLKLSTEENNNVTENKTKAWFETDSSSPSTPVSNNTHVFNNLEGNKTKEDKKVKADITNKNKDEEEATVKFSEFNKGLEINSSLKPLEEKNKKEEEERKIITPTSNYKNVAEVVDKKETLENKLKSMNTETNRNQPKHSNPKTNNIKIVPLKDSNDTERVEKAKKLISKRSLVKCANKDDPDLEVFIPPEPRSETDIDSKQETDCKPEEEGDEDVFVPLKSNDFSQFMNPWKKPKQLDVCPVEIFARPKTIRGRHYPRPKGHPAPVQEESSSEEESDEESEESETSSEEESSSEEDCDSGFGSKDKGSSESRDSPTSNHANNPAFALDSGDLPFECSQSSTYASFQKSGRITPPATTIPRFRKYCVDDFNFLKVLGKGSFGKVLLAELKGTEYYYAVKCLKKDVVLEDDDVECTLIERKVLALGTKHPYLCHLLCTFQTESHLFFVMEYLNGGDLMFHIQASGRFPEHQARFYAAEIVSGLKFLHNKGIVYRDLKLDNVLLDFDGHVRIADFGMCKLQIFLDRMAETFCGTPDYMAPEIIKGQHYNQCVDWWSFGVLLYEMLLGQSPFSGCDEDELFWSICNEKPVLPRFLSAEATNILTLILEKDASKRLGNRFSPHGDIQDHVFFRLIDWRLLENRQLDPPFKPILQHPLDTKYFDKHFTIEKAKITPTDPNILQSMDQTQFQGFSYTNPNATDK